MVVSDLHERFPALYNLGQSIGECLEAARQVAQGMGSVRVCVECSKTMRTGIGSNGAHVPVVAYLGAQGLQNRPQTPHGDLRLGWRVKLGFQEMELGRKHRHRQKERHR